MWAALWPGEETPIGHVTNGVHLGTWLDPGLAELLRAAGVRPEAPPDEATGTPRGDLDPEALWRVHSAAKARLAERPGFDRELADDRLRPPLRDLQARRPGLLRPRAAARAAAADRRRRQGAPGRRARQGRDAGASSSSPATRALAGASSSWRTTTWPRPRARPRLRRVAEHAAPSARGLRDERDEGGGQRRPQPLGARRLVGRGLLARGRLGDRRHRRRRRPRAALPPARGAGRADSGPTTATAGSR